MRVQNKDYQLVPPEEVTTRGGKLIILVSGLFNDYLQAKPEEEDKKFDELCQVWKKLVPEIVIDSDDFINDMRKIPAKSIGEILQNFFTSSEAKP